MYEDREEMRGRKKRETQAQTHTSSTLRIATHLFAFSLFGRSCRYSFSGRCTFGSLIPRCLGRLASLVPRRRDGRRVSSPPPHRSISLDGAMSLPLPPRIRAPASTGYTPARTFNAPAAATTRAPAPVIMECSSPFAIISACTNPVLSVTDVGG
jgi:hypothetical protein